MLYNLIRISLSVDTNFLSSFKHLGAGCATISIAGAGTFRDTGGFTAASSPSSWHAAQTIANVYDNDLSKSWIFYNGQGNSTEFLMLISRETPNNMHKTHTAHKCYA